MVTRRTAMLGLAGLLTGCTAEPAPRRPHFGGSPPVTGVGLQQLYQLEQLHAPQRTVVRGADGRRLAELTHGCRTVLLPGKQRIFTEPATTRASVTTEDWVRVAPHRYSPALATDPGFAEWLQLQLADTTPDVLCVACEYITGKGEQHDTTGVRYAGDAGFGYINNESTRDGADFYDYLGIPWRWPDGKTSTPARKWRGTLDCSGYIRLIFGYRLGMPLHRGNRTVTDGLPRTAYAMAVRTPGTVIADAEAPDQAPADLTRVAAGDLAFFALHDDQPDLITHSGIVLGRDQRGEIRFVSARETADGPTFGDVGGAGVIDRGHFGARLRRVFRL